MKKILTLVIVTILLVVSVGCASSDPKTPSVEKAEINYMVSGGSPFSVAVIKKIPEFEAATGIKVNVIELPYEQTLPKAILEATSQSGVYDVIQINRPNLAALVEPDLLLPLNDLLSKSTIDNLFDVHKEYGTFDSSLYAVPHSVDVRTLYYRTDLFEEKGIAKAPETWEELRDAANALNDPANGVYGLLIAGNNGPGAWTLSDFLMQAGSGIIDENGKPILNNEAGVKALTFIKSLKEDGVLSDGTPNYIWSDTRAQFAQGAAAMVIEFNDIVPMLEDATTSVVSGKYDLALIPGDVRQATNNAGWLLGIPKGVKNPEAASTFIDWVMSPEIQMHMSIESGTMSANKEAMQMLVDNGDPGLGREDPRSSARWELYTQLTATTYELPRTSSEPEIEEILAQAYSAVFVGQKTPKQALDDAAKAIEGL